MENPWQKIAWKDYEDHMRLDSIFQLQALNAIMREQFSAYKGKTVMILGVAVGNGLEHINRDRVQRVYGVDINPEYLRECQRRYPQLEGILQTVCADLTDPALQLPRADVLIANLLIEYIGSACFQGIVERGRPQAVSCVLQRDTGDSFVSVSPYQHVFDGLQTIHHSVEEGDLLARMEAVGYRKVLEKETALPNGKALVRMDFVENKGEEEWKT